MRVYLRALEQGDWLHTRELLQDASVMAFIGPRRALSNIDARQWFDQNIKNPERYAVALKETGELIGFCGIKHIDGINDFGYFFRKAFWGKGLAHEAIQLSIQKLKADYDVSQLEVFIADENHASLALANRIKWAVMKRGKKEQEQGCFFRLS